MDWEQAKIDYVSNPNESYRSIAERYGVSQTQVANHSRDEGWRQLREEYLQNVCMKTLDALAAQKARREAKIVSVADKLLNKLDKAVDDCPPEALVKNAKLIRALTGAVLDLKQIHNIRSDLDLQEQKARIEKLRRDAAADDPKKEKSFEVVFAGGDVEEWSE